MNSVIKLSRLLVSRKKLAVNQLKIEKKSFDTSVWSQKPKRWKIPLRKVLGIAIGVGLIAIASDKHGDNGYKNSDDKEDSETRNFHCKYNGCEERFTDLRAQRFVCTCICFCINWLE